MVTRSLVSYDYTINMASSYQGLNGHQIIGELRHHHWFIHEDVLVIEWSPDHW